MEPCVPSRASRWLSLCTASWSCDRNMSLTSITQRKYVWWLSIISLFISRTVQLSHTLRGASNLWLLPRATDKCDSRFMICLSPQTWMCRIIMWNVILLLPSQWNSRFKWMYLQNRSVIHSSVSCWETIQWRLALKPVNQLCLLIWHNYTSYNIIINNSNITLCGITRGRVVEGRYVPLHKMAAGQTTSPRMHGSDRCQCLSPIAAE